MLFLKITATNFQCDNLKIAAKAINDGKLVAFPTETVYGLGSDVFNSRAVSKIFEIKKRPLNDPLIVHIADKASVFDLSKEVSDKAVKLMKKFWPGPLTLVLKKSNIVSDIVTAGLDTVAIRMPENLIALSLIKLAKTPLAAPSANLFGRTSPTCAQHVVDDFSDKIDVIIDGGKCSVGVESTVLDMTEKIPVILRPGGITKEAIEKIIKFVKVNNENNYIIRSPGMMKKHYSPKAKLVLVEKKNGQIEEMKRLASDYIKKNKNVGIMTVVENERSFNNFNVKSIGEESNIRDCAINIFSVMRSFDTEKIDVIIAGAVEEQGIGIAIMDRLRKAAN